MSHFFLNITGLRRIARYVKSGPPLLLRSLILHQSAVLTTPLPALVTQNVEYSTYINRTRSLRKTPLFTPPMIKKISFILYSSIRYFRTKMWYLCTKASHVYSILTKDFAIECVLFYFLLPTQRVNRFDELCGPWKLFRVPRKSV